jgi:hypothetical protein
MPTEKLRSCCGETLSAPDWERASIGGCEDSGCEDSGCEQAETEATKRARAILLHAM